MNLQQVEAVILNNIFLCYGLIPLTSMVLSAYLQLGNDRFNWDLRPNAAGDLYSFTLALDATLLVSKSAMIQKISNQLASNYEPILVVFLFASFFLMVFSARTQAQINKKTKNKYYPLASVAVCWMFGVGFISAHIYLLVGK